MKTIYNFIIEKLRLKKDIGSDKQDPTDYTSWEVGDIIYCFGGHIEFYRIKRKTSKTFELAELDVKLLSGYYNSAKYTAVPNENKESNETVKGRPTKYGGFNIGKHTFHGVFLWDGEPVEGTGLFF